MPSPASSRNGRSAAPLFQGYQPLGGAYDELFEPSGQPRAASSHVLKLLDSLGSDEFKLRRRLADSTFLRSGITFSVYSDNQGSERIFPFDLIPRIVPAAEWEWMNRALKQRVLALNAFLEDVYSQGFIVQDKIIPKHFIHSSQGYVPLMRGVRPPKGVYVHVAGIDLVRGRDGRYVVLEDNLRVPSGVSYVLENRMVMKKVFPRVFERSRVEPVEEYPARLRESLAQVAPGRAAEKRVVVLTPGPFNSAYFEHTFLARQMGCELVQGPDLVVDDDMVFAKTTRGLARVSTIYRRVDDAFLDPTVFNKDSVLGVKGLVQAYVKGNVAIANAIGNGVADDKGIYPFVPRMIRFYLSEEPLLDQVQTYICDRKDECSHVLANLGKLVVKSVNEAGGYGMIVGPRATRKQLADFKARIQAQPRNFIAQPLVELSTCPTWTPRGVGPRRIDLRPYVVTGDKSWVLPGGLTRVALVRGSYVVNSSQGGGSKDTWVLQENGT